MQLARTEIVTSRRSNLQVAIIRGCAYRDHPARRVVAAINPAEAAVSDSWNEFQESAAQLSNPLTLLSQYPAQRSFQRAVMVLNARPGHRSSGSRNCQRVLLLAMSLNHIGIKANDNSLFGRPGVSKLMAINKSPSFRREPESSKTNVSFTRFRRATPSLAHTAATSTSFTHTPVNAMYVRRLYAPKRCREA